MKTIEERAKEYAPDPFLAALERKAYIAGATDQKAIDDELCKSGEVSDGYHTFNELYDFRREYNAALVNSGVWKAHKSYRHHSGELCFGGGWFIVMIETPFGQISNHYENKYWDEFHCEEKEFADEWDGHTEKDVIERLMKCNLQNQTVGNVLKWANETMIDKACKSFCHIGCPHKTDSYDCLNNKCDTWKIFRKMMEE